MPPTALSGQGGKSGKHILAESIYRWRIRLCFHAAMDSPSTVAKLMKGRAMQPRSKIHQNKNENRAFPSYYFSPPFFKQRTTPRRAVALQQSWMEKQKHWPHWQIVNVTSRGREILKQSIENQYKRKKIKCLFCKERSRTDRAPRGASTQQPQFWKVCSPSKVSKSSIKSSINVNNTTFNTKLVIAPSKYLCDVVQRTSIMDLRIIPGIIRVTIVN